MKRIKLVLLSVLALAVFLICSADTQHRVRATKYYAGHGCGYVTADGSRIDVKKVHNGTIRWVALSPDMFKKGYKLGDRIHVTSSNSRLNGVWVVKDKMASWKRNSIDFLMTKENSKDFDNPCHVTIRKI